MGSRCILRQAYNQIRAKANQKLYLLRKNYYNNKIEQHKGDLKTTWKILKSAIGKTQKTTGIERININGMEVIDQKQIAENCNEYFASIGDKLAKEIQSSDEQSSHCSFKTSN